MKSPAKWLGLTALLTYILIVVGAAVRVTDSGMSCPDWPTCYGVWWPFPVSFEETGYTNMQVFLEWVHRAIASVVGFFLLGSLWTIFKDKQRHPKLGLFAILSVLVLIVQIKIGMLTVMLSNIHWSVAVHLGNAMVFFGLLIVTRKLAAMGQDDPLKFDVSCKNKCALWGITVLTFLTMIMGAMVSSSHAGGVCGGLLSCMGDWMPKEDLGQLLHMKHRYMAIMTFVAILAFYMVNRKDETPLKKTAFGLKVLVSVQVLIGIVTLYSFSHYAEYYQFLSVFHLAWGTLLFMACIGGLAKVYFGASGTFHKKGNV